MRSFKLKLATAILATSPVIGFAGDESVSLSTYRISVADLYKAAMASDPNMIAAQANLWRSEAISDAAFGRLLPQISFQSSYSRTHYENDINSTSYNGKKAGLTLTQAIYDPISSAAADRAEQDIKKTDSDQLAAQFTSAVNLVERYFAVLAAQDRVALLSEQRGIIAKNLEQVESLLARKLARVTDKLSLTAQKHLVDAQLLAAQNELLLAQESLSEIVGELPANVPLASMRESDDLLKLTNVSNLDELIDSALQKNPSVVSSRWAVESARSALEEAQAGHKPKVTLQASADYSNIGYANSPSSNTQSASIGFALQVPIYAGGSTTSRAEAALESLTIAEQELELTQRSIRRNLKLSFLGLENALARIRASESASDSASQALEAAEKSFEYGITNVVEVANRSGELYQAKVELNQARYELVTNYINLITLQGDFTEEAIHSIDQLLDNSTTSDVRSSG